MQTCGRRKWYPEHLMEIMIVCMMSVVDSGFEESFSHINLI